MSQAHWDSAYAVDNLDELGWYEPLPSTLGLVTAYSKPADSVIDVGVVRARQRWNSPGSGTEI